MGMKHPRVPKISRHEKSAVKRVIKQLTNRRLRRAARLDPSHAPTKVRHYDYTE